MLHKISSPSNPLVKELKALHSKKGRSESGLFLAEGARLVTEAALCGYRPRIVMAASDALERPATRRLVLEAKAAGARCVETTPAILESVSKRDNAQTLIAAFAQHDRPLSDLNPAASRLWVALDRVRDPGNLGTIWRTADAVGAGGLILIGQTCDPFSVEAVRATMGSVFAVPIVKAEFEAFNAWRQSGGLALVGASLNGALRPDAAPTQTGIVALMGNEQAGLPEQLEAACDLLVKIPMRGRADSLNLAAATAVVLYDLWRGQNYEGAR